MLLSLEMADYFIAKQGWIPASNPCLRRRIKLHIASAQAITDGAILSNEAILFFFRRSPITQLHANGVFHPAMNRDSTEVSRVRRAIYVCPVTAGYLGRFQAN